MSDNKANLTTAIPTLVGSLLSCMASSLAICSHILVPPTRRHFRHALILNLLAADFINSLNNTISGILVIKNGYADPKEGPSTQCLANAWVGQFSVQAIDFNILIISITVLMAVRQNYFLADSSRRVAAIVCLTAWVPGTITSFVGLGLGVYGPVSGNWCWIQSEHLALRYALTHGWRIAIFIATIVIYTMIYVQLRRVFGRLKFSLTSSATTRTTTSVQTEMDPEAAEQPGKQPGKQYTLLVDTTYETPIELSDRAAYSSNSVQNADQSGKKIQWGFSRVTKAPASQSAEVHNTSRSTQQSSTATHPAARVPASPNLRRMLLLNGYPIAYIILWIPGMANRLVESVGTSPLWLTALQSSTQYIGLINALTYGLTEQIQRALRLWMKKRRFLTIEE